MRKLQKITQWLYYALGVVLRCLRLGRVLRLICYGGVAFGSWCAFGDWTITCVNNGNSTATGVQIQLYDNGNGYTHNLSTLAPGASDSWTAGGSLHTGAHGHGIADQGGAGPDYSFANLTGVNYCYIFPGGTNTPTTNYCSSATWLNLYTFPMICQPVENGANHGDWAIVRSGATYTFSDCQTYPITCSIVVEDGEGNVWQTVTGTNVTYTPAQTNPPTASVAIPTNVLGGVWTTNLFPNGSTNLSAEMSTIYQGLVNMGTAMQNMWNSLNGTMTNIGVSVNRMSNTTVNLTVTNSPTPLTVTNIVNNTITNSLFTTNYLSLGVSNYNNNTVTNNISLVVTNGGVDDGSSNLLAHILGTLKGNEGPLTNRGQVLGGTNFDTLKANAEAVMSSSGLATKLQDIRDLANSFPEAGDDSYELDKITLATIPSLSDSLNQVWDPMGGQWADVWYAICNLARWLLALFFVMRILKESFEFVKLMGYAQQIHIPEIQGEVFGIGGNVGAALYPVLIIAMMAAFGFLLGAICTSIADAWPTFQMLATNPVGDQGGSHVTAGLHMLKKAFPFDTFLSLSAAYLLWRVTMTSAGAIFIMVVRSIIG